MKRFFKVLFAGILFSLATMGCFTAYAASAPIANGYYMVRSGNSNARFLDIASYSLQNGGNLQIYSSNKGTNQIFYFQHRKDGYYTIQAVHSGKYLHNSGKNLNVHQWGGWNYKAAMWKPESAGKGYYYFRNMETGKYLDNSGGKTKLGNNVGLYKQNKSNSQKWYLVKMGKPSFTSNVSMTSVPSGTLTNPQTVALNGSVKLSYPATNVQIGIFTSAGKYVTGTTISPSNRMNFSFSARVNLSSLASGNYFFGMKFTNAYNQTLQSAKYTFSINKVVTPSYAKPANGTYYLSIALNNDYVAEVYREKTNNGANIQLYTNKRGTHQKFQITHVSDGWYKIIDSHSKKALDVAGGVAKSGINVQLWDYASVPAQLWRFYNAGNNYYYIQNKLGFYLDVSGGISNNGTNIQVYTGNKTNSQKWLLLTDQKETERLQKKINAATNSFITAQNNFNTYGNQAVSNVEKSYNGLKTSKQTTIFNAVHNMIATNLPAGVEKAFTDVLFNNVDKSLSSKPSSYDKVKSAVDLVKKVANDTPGGTTKITFSVGKQTYVAEITYQSVWGNTVYFLTFNNRYKGIGVSINDNNIETEMGYLKKFAQSKIDEAKKALYKDSLNLIIPSELKNFLKTTTKSAIYSELKKYSPQLEAQVKAADSMATKFIDLKNAYDGLNSIKLGSSDAEKVANTILNYNKKIEAYNTAASAFTGLR